jgi:hypothetical protein
VQETLLLLQLCGCYWQLSSRLLPLLVLLRCTANRLLAGYCCLSSTSTSATNSSSSSSRILAFGFHPYCFQRIFVCLLRTLPIHINALRQVPKAKFCDLPVQPPS